jgi:chromosome segregation ATPase
MSDPNKYINYYVENSMTMVHEYINTLLQTKTQLRVLEDQVKEKDTAIASLQNELNTHLSNKQEVDRAVANATNWENSFNDMKNKVSHMDTLNHQIGEAKKMLVEKNAELTKALGIIDDLKKQAAEKDGQIKELKKLVPSVPSPKKAVINKKKSTTVGEEAVKETKTPVAPYVPGVVGTKVPYEPPKKANNEVALKVVNVVEPENETDDF